MTALEPRTFCMLHLPQSRAAHVAMEGPSVLCQFGGVELPQGKVKNSELLLHGHLWIQLPWASYRDRSHQGHMEDVKPTDGQSCLCSASVWMFDPADHGGPRQLSPRTQIIWKDWLRSLHCKELGVLSPHVQHEHNCLQHSFPLLLMQANVEASNVGPGFLFPWKLGWELNFKNAFDKKATPPTPVKFKLLLVCKTQKKKRERLCLPCEMDTFFKKKKERKVEWISGF